MSDLAGLLEVATDNTASVVEISGTTLAVLMYALSKLEDINQWKDYRQEVISEADLEIIHDIVEEANFEVMTAVTIPPQVYPQGALIHPMQSQLIAGGSLSMIPASGQVMGASAEVLAIANGNAFEWPFFLDTGEYYMRFYYLRGTNFGMVDITIDGANIIAGLDAYNATAQNSILSNIWVGIYTPGNHMLRVTVNGKRAASTSYRFVFAGVAFDRLGDV